MLRRFLVTPYCNRVPLCPACSSANRANTGVGHAISTTQRYNRHGASVLHQIRIYTACAPRYDSLSLAPLHPFRSSLGCPCRLSLSAIPLGAHRPCVETGRDEWLGCGSLRCWQGLAGWGLWRAANVRRADTAISLLTVNRAQASALFFCPAIATARRTGHKKNAAPMGAAFSVRKALRFSFQGQGPLMQGRLQRPRHLISACRPFWI